MPSTTFAELGVPAELVRTLRARGLTDAFDIQAMTVPDGLAGRDLCGRAPTGSGKTIAFGIPLVARVGQARPKHPRALVLVPTRELAAQVCGELEWLGGGRKLRVAAVYGGAGFGAQFKALRRGVDVLVACPGRLTDLIERREVRLDEVEMVVVDEADRMADMGFLPAVSALLDLTPATRQTLLFSATLDGAVDQLVRRYQRDPSRHMLPEADQLAATHHFWAVDRAKRVDLTAEIVAAAGPTIVFCRTKHGADALAKKLDQRGVRSAAIHGNRSQGQRERALAAFADGKVSALVATDVAAAASTSTRSRAWCTSTRRPTSRTTRTAPDAPRVPVPRASSCRWCRPTRRGSSPASSANWVSVADSPGPTSAASASETPATHSLRCAVPSSVGKRRATATDGRPRGTIKWFDAAQGLRLHRAPRRAATCSCTSRRSRATATAASRRARRSSSSSRPARRATRPQRVRVLAAA